MESIEAINDLVSSTSDLINSSIKSISRKKFDTDWGDYNDEAKDEEIRLEHNLDKTSRELFDLRDQIIVNNLQQDEDKWNQLKSIFACYVSEQMDEFEDIYKQNIEFIEDDKVQLNWITSELVTSHRNELISNIKNEQIEIPGVFLDSALDMLQESIDKFIATFKTIEKPIDLVSFIDEWTTFTENTFKSFETNKIKFWNLKCLRDDNQLLEIKDKSNNSQTYLIKHFLKLFLYCQDTKSEQEMKELSYCFENMIEWLRNSSEMTQETYESLNDILYSFRSSVYQK